jgi:hypothetical protein
MTYDLATLTRLGRRRTKLLDELEQLKTAIGDEIRAAAAADVPQILLIRASGYSREQVRVLTDPSKWRSRARVR